MGCQVITPFRGDGEKSRELKLAGDLGQIVPLPFYLGDKESIFRAVQRSDVVINLIGHKTPTRAHTLEQTNVESAQSIAQISKEAGVAKFIHFSCSNANVNSRSDFFRTKGLSEVAVRNAFPSATIVRPTLLFGDEDDLLIKLAQAINSPMRGLILAGWGSQRMQPVHVDDVADAMLPIISHPKAPGNVVDLFGPTVITRLQLAELIMKEILLEKPISVLSLCNAGVLPCPAFVNNFLERYMASLSRETYIQDTTDCLAPQRARGHLRAEDLGLTPTDLLATLPGIVRVYRMTRHLSNEITVQRLDKLEMGRAVSFFRD